MAAGRAPSLVAYLESRDIHVQDGVTDATSGIRDRRIPVALVFDADYADGSSRASRRRWRCCTTRRGRSRRVSPPICAALTDYTRSVGETRLVLRGVAPAAIAAIRVLERDFATAADRAGRALATMPIFVLLAAFIGGMSVAADVAAGERERGTLESLLLHPMGRLDDRRRQMAGGLVGRW